MSLPLDGSLVSTGVADWPSHGVVLAGRFVMDAAGKQAGLDKRAFRKSVMDDDGLFNETLRDRRISDTCCSQPAAIY